MGHNTSERRERELEAEARRHASAGWLLQADGKVEEPQTPAGVLARGSVLTGRCGKRPDCGRRVRFDARAWCASGHGVTPLADILDSYRCGLVPCRLDWAPETYPSGLPLGAYLSDPAANVIVSCGCGGLKPRRYPVRAFARLVVQGGGSAALALPAPPARPPAPVALSPGLIRGACPACGDRRWRITLFRSQSPGGLG